MSKRKVIINSNLDREPGGTSSNFQVYLSRPLEAHRGRVKIGLRKAVIPNTAYNLHVSESILWFVQNPDTQNELLDSIQVDVDRIYQDSNDLADEVNARLDAKGYDDLVCEVNELTGRLRFRSTDNNTYRLIGDYIFELEYNGVPLFNHINRRLGIVEDTRGTLIDSNGTWYQATGLPKLVNTLVYHVTSGQLGNEYNTTTPSKFDNPKIIMTMMNNVPYGFNNTQIYDDSEMFTVVLQDGLNEFDIQIRDEEYRIVDLKGANVYLEFDYWFI